VSIWPKTVSHNSLIYRAFTMKHGQHVYIYYGHIYLLFNIYYTMGVGRDILSNYHTTVNIFFK